MDSKRGLSTLGALRRDELGSRAPRDQLCRTFVAFRHFCRVASKQKRKRFTEPGNDVKNHGLQKAKSVALRCSGVSPAAGSVEESVSSRFVERVDECLTHGSGLRSKTVSKWKKVVEGQFSCDAIMSMIWSHDRLHNPDMVARAMRSE